MNKNITFKEGVPGSFSYFKLFETTTWNKKYKADKNELYHALSNSWYTLSVYNNETDLIGFGRLISDGVLYAFVCDLIIHPRHQNQSTGSLILKKLIEQCKKEKIRVIWLFSASDKSGFYLKQGFHERPSNAPGMEMDLCIDC